MTADRPYVIDIADPDGTIWFHWAGRAAGLTEARRLARRGASLKWRIWKAHDPRAAILEEPASAKATLSKRGEANFHDAWEIILPPPPKRRSGKPDAGTTAEMRALSLALLATDPTLIARRDEPDFHAIVFGGPNGVARCQIWSDGPEGKRLASRATQEVALALCSLHAAQGKILLYEDALHVTAPPSATLAATWRKRRLEGADAAFERAAQKLDEVGAEDLAQECRARLTALETLF